MDIPAINLTLNSGINLTAMLDSVELDSVCGETDTSGGGNSSLCNNRAPGVSMASPICMFVTGVLGNILALAVLHTTGRELRKTPYFILLLGLAWSDLFSQLMTSPVIISVYANNLQWHGGKPLCIYTAFVMIGFGIILPVLVCCLSIERLLALRFTYLYSRIVTLGRAKLLFVLCWIFVIIFCTGPLIGFGRYARQFPGTWCFLNFHNESSSDTAYAFTFALLNVTVIAIIVCCNFTVVITLLKMRKSRRQNGSPSAVRRRYIQPKKNLLQMEMETQMVWFLCAVTVVFVACWLPLNVHIVLTLSTDSIDYSGDLKAIRLASINQILDPWLYILLRKSVLLKIRGCLKRFLLCGGKGRGHPDGRAVDAGIASQHDNDLTSGNELSVHLVDTNSELYCTCERNTDSGFQLIPLKESESSDSDVFLDSNSARCFPVVYDTGKGSTNSGYCFVRRHRVSTDDTYPRKTLHRLFSLPVDIRT